MLVTIAILILLITPLALLLIQWRVAGFRFSSFLAGGAMIVAWGLLLLARRQLPILFVLPARGVERLFADPFTLLIDHVSWIFALALVSFGAAVLFNTHKQIRFFPIWVLSMILVGVMASFSANPITLLYAWTLMDLLIFLILLHGASKDVAWTKVVSAFTFRLLSLAFVMAAGLLAYSRGEPLTFAAIPPSINTYLVLAAVLHFGIWIPSSAFEPERIYEPVLRIIPTVAGLAIIVRVAQTGLPSSLRSPFLIIAGTVALLSGLLWLLSPKSQPSLRVWTVGMGTLSVGAALLGFPHPSLAWSMVLLLGSVPFLVSDWSISVSILSIVSFLGILVLPFFPWSGFPAYDFKGWGLILGGGYGLLAAGYLNHCIEKHKARLQPEFWEVWPRLVGLVILLITPLVVSFGVGNLSLRFILETDLWLVGLLTMATLVGGVIWKQMFSPRREPILKAFSLFSEVPRIFTQVVKILYGLLSRSIHFLSEVFEGEGGVIWTLVGAFLLITILASLGGG